MADVRRFLMKPDDILAAVFPRLSANGSGVGVVAQSDRKVLGVVVDTRLRHAVLAGAALEDPVGHHVIPLRSAGRLPVLPVVERGRLVDIVANPRAPVHPPAVAVVMAGGRGKRLRPITDKVPKPLLQVGQSTIIERIMVSLARAGVSDIYLALNYKAHLFRKRIGTGEHIGARVHYVIEDAPLGTAGALGLLPERPEGPVLVTNADIVTRLDYARLFEFHRAHRGPATMTGVEFATQIPYGVLRLQRDRLKAMEEKPEVRVRCNAGMYVIAPETLDLIVPGEPVDMPVLLDRVMESGEPVRVFPVVEKWIDSGSPEEFERVLIDFATGEEV